jgi:hypothetical protein
MGIARGPFRRGDPAGAALSNSRRAVAAGYGLRGRQERQPEARLEVFKQGLAELGYVEGKNVRIEYRDAVLDAEYHDVMADLVNQQVNIILAGNVAAAVAAGKATKTIRSCY